MYMLLLITELMETKIILNEILKRRNRTGAKRSGGMWQSIVWRKITKVLRINFEIPRGSAGRLPPAALTCRRDLHCEMLVPPCCYGTMVLRRKLSRRKRAGKKSRKWASTKFKTVPLHFLKLEYSGQFGFFSAYSSYSVTVCWCVSDRLVNQSSPDGSLCLAAVPNP